MTSRCLLGGSLLLIAVFIGTANPLCVLESDFGFKINCAFKKSGLFRVRNLGGIKAHASLGFSLGDELGFEQSLTNQDPSRRRSVSIKNGVPNLVADTSGGTGTKQEKRGKQNRIMRPIVLPNRPNQAAMDKLSSLHRRVTTMQPIVVPGPESSPAKAPSVTMAKPMAMGVPPFRPLPPKEDTLAVVPITATRKPYSPLQIPQSKGPGLAYQSELYPQSHNQISKMVSQMTAEQYSPTNRITPNPIIVNPHFVSKTTVNPFVPMPHSALTIIPAPVFKEIHAPNTLSPTYIHNSVSIQKNPLSNFIDPVPHQVHDLASAVYNTKKIDDYNSITGYGDDTTLKFSKEDINSKIAEIAKAGNISMEAVEAAIALRQQQLLSKYANIPVPTSPPTSSTTTTTEEPFVFQPEPEPEILSAAITQKPKRMPTTGKVMNAPREYYPVGYEKNFDDHFQTKVDLPDTSFYCGDQKYFPGLYGDESLGCMVFHVCALTDDGLVMKSFLCPESTLFDQTILKCNWWFYVDCKNTKKLYDTNIPVSKSYQLMKALTFFSSYKKEMQNDGQPSNSEDMQGIKDAISILENQDSKKAEATNIPNVVQYITPTPLIDERNNRKPETTEAAPVYRGNRNYDGFKDSRTNTTIDNTDIKLVTVNADVNITQGNTTEVTSEESREKKHRRRMTLKYSSGTNNTTQGSTTTSTSTTTTSRPTIFISSPIVELMKQEIRPMENLTSPVKEEKLTDQIEEINQLATDSAPVRRFYRSSAEKYEEKEMAVVNNENVLIVRPTSRYIGQYATPAAAIEKLDEAVLGKRTKKEAIAIVTPEKESPNT